MLLETEIKLNLKSEEEARELMKKLESLSGGKFEYEEQRDEYYDGGNKEISDNKLVVRLRILNGKPIVALKGPPTFLKGAINRRVELEFEAASEEQVREKIKKQNLVPYAIIEKRRWEFHLDKAKVAIDEVPYIGWFVEIEGKGVEEIEKMIKNLGLSENEKLMGNYGDLLDTKMKELGRPGRPNLRVAFE